jgi:putative spermidine/putrescine transport system permease protein
MISRMLRGSRAFWLGLLNVAANFGGIGLAFSYTATVGTVGMLTLIIQGSGSATRRRVKVRCRRC